MREGSSERKVVKKGREEGEDLVGFGFRLTFLVKPVDNHLCLARHDESSSVDRDWTLSHQ